MKFGASLRNAGVILFAQLIAAAASAEPQTINSCRVIDKPGSYRLQKVLIASASDLSPATAIPACIVVAADFVTIDLDGYAILSAEAGTGAGIADDNNNRRGTTVRNGSIAFFAVGVWVRGPSATIEGIRAINNTEGLTLSPAHGHKVVRNAVNDNGIGILVTGPCVVLDNVAAGNGLDIAADARCTRLGNSPLP